MKYPLRILAAVGVVAAAGLTAKTMTHAAPASIATRTPVIVELFTSEGCSSCPPADALLRQFEKDPPVPGAQVIALGEHVDYWNHGGWADRFSSARYSARQAHYSRVFGLNQVYTPQMVVDGHAQFIGGDETAARAAIARAARWPKADVQLSRPAGSDTLSVRVGRLPDDVKGDPADVILAITEDGLSSSVSGGENAGRHLDHAAVLRQLTFLGTTSGGVFTAAPRVTLGGNRHAVVFVQERNSRLIVGAAQTDLL